MTDEKKPFSFAAPFTAPKVDPEPNPEPVAEQETGVTLEDVLSVATGSTSTWSCTWVEAEPIYVNTRDLRASGALKMIHKDGELTVRRVKD